MTKLINSKLLLQVIVASMVATLATAGIVGAATTIGSNINTGGTLTTTGATTIYGATSIGGALTATSTLAVTGVSTLTGNTILSTASSTGLVKVDSLQLGITAITATGIELNYVAGVTSALQTQLDAKAALASPALTGTATFVNASSTGWLKTATINSDTGTVDFGDDNITTSGNVDGIDVSGIPTTYLALAGGTMAGNLNLTTASSTGLVKVDSLQLGVTAITATGIELNYVDGVTSALQTQLDAKSPLANPTFTGTLNVGGYATTTSSGIIMPAQQITTNIGCETATVGGLIFNNAKKILCICVGTSWQAATSTTPTACF